MHYVIFVPNAGGYNANELLSSLGLDSLIDNIVGVGACDATLGDDSGKLLRWDDAARPERNATEGVDDKEWWWDHKRRFAIGWNADDPPKPEDLQRNYRYADDPLLTSFPCKLQDNRIWLVPIARHLPRQWSQCTETGQPMLAPKTEFAWYWEENTSAFEQLCGGQISLDAQPAWLFDLALRDLALNYRICKEVAYATGLFGEADAAQVVAASCEFSMEFDARLTWSVRANNPILAQKKTANSLAVNAT